MKRIRYKGIYENVMTKFGLFVKGEAKDIDDKKADVLLRDADEFELDSQEDKISQKKGVK